LRENGEKISFVPTMGALHEGHLELVKKAYELACSVVVSIFVNPAQFGKNEDFSRYPRDLDGDMKKIGQAWIDAGAGKEPVIFFPQADEIYPKGYETYVSLERLSEHLCGLTRHGHFRGVATVVLKLFNIVQPHFAVFGEKDFQQIQVIKKMVRDLNVPVEIIPYPTVREPDGLAMSSRNQYLTPDERKRAAVIYAQLKKAGERLLGEKSSIEAIVKSCILEIESVGGIVEYFEVCDKETLKSLEEFKGGAVIAVAARFGATRLIDNIIV
ncbi:MAG: pantoate--beta-alanine ligase, partial [Deltaproteobacteria bacterium]|nr:pantoate--beta-alanine ligase [Deltaproteobacteria bacterium]